MKPSNKVFYPFIVLCFVSNSCVTFKVPPLAPPDNIEAEITICQKIDANGELLRPLEKASEFGLETENIYCFIKLINVQKEIKLKWKWYSPDNILFRESEEAIVNQTENLLETVTAYDKIPLHFENEVFGEWVVIILLNDVLIARKSFIIKSEKQVFSFSETSAKSFSYHIASAYVFVHETYPQAFL